MYIKTTFDVFSFTCAKCENIKWWLHYNVYFAYVGILFNAI